MQPQEAHAAFTGSRHDEIVTARVGRRYGAILWEASADLDHAIRTVKTFDNPDDAIRLVAPTCEDGERWAVVDLQTMDVVAKGTRPIRQLPV
jgi:hypothetical protein